MKTTFLLTQHSKCFAALEMIQRCDIYIGHCRKNLRRHFGTHFIKQMPGVEEWNLKTIDKYLRIKERMIVYYHNQLLKMAEPVEV